MAEKQTSEEELEKVVRKTPLAELNGPLELKWRRGEDMPFEMFGNIQAIAIGNNVYVGGGNSENSENLDNSNIVVVYSLQTESWRTLPPHETKWFGMASMNNQLVLVGGASMLRSADNVTNVLVVWDEESQTWTRPFPAMPTARHSPSVISYQKWLIVAGGIYETGSQSSRVELLDTVSGQWYEGSPLPTKCMDMSSAINGNMCYMSGGVSAPGEAIRDLFITCFDELISQAVSRPTSSTSSPWQTLREPPPEHSSVLILNGYLMAVGERKSLSIHLYQPGRRNWAKVGDLPCDYSLCRCARTFLPNGEMFVAGYHRIYIAQLYY